MRHAEGLTPQDRLDLSDLVHRYALHVDAGDVAAVLALFSDEAVMLVPEPPRTLTPDVVRPRDRIPEAMAALGDVVRTVHEVLGVVVDAGPTDGTARGLVRAVAHHAVDSDGTLVDVVWRGRYEDEYRRTDDGWRFLSRALTLDIIEERPVTAVRR